MIVHSIGGLLAPPSPGGCGWGSTSQRRLYASSCPDSSCPADATGWVFIKSVAETCKKFTPPSRVTWLGSTRPSYARTENAPMFVTSASTTHYYLIFIDFTEN